MLKILDWDSKHFGYPIGKIELSESNGFDIEPALQQAQNRQLKLVYVFIEEASDSIDDIIDQTVLPETAVRVDERKTYFLDLSVLDSIEDAPTKGKSLQGFEFKEAKEALDAQFYDELFGLALLAGSESRFFHDRRICAQKAKELYKIWIENSVKGVLADCVLQALGPNKELAGFISFKTAKSVSNIGLFAVHPQFQGKGLGSCLLAEAHDRMKKSGSQTSTVVTQGKNFRACNAYLRNGYKLMKTEHVYHVWF